MGPSSQGESPDSVELDTVAILPCHSAATRCFRHDASLAPEATWHPPRILGHDSQRICCCCSVTQLCLFVTPQTATCQASLSFTICMSLLKLMSVESMMPSNNLILCHPLLLLPSIFPSIRVIFNELAVCISGPSVGASASALVLPMNIQG